METELTQRIKTRIRYFRPQLKTELRTIRWAEEVWTETGIVDVIRFEDYIQHDNTYCARISPTGDDRQRPLFDLRVVGTCKLEGKTYPCRDCRGCVYRHTVHELGILTTCFEVKITMSDFKSGNGHNFHGNRNYYAVPAAIADAAAEIAAEGIGVIAYYDSGTMKVKRECEHRHVAPEELNYLLFNALKKWADGTQETKRR